GLYAPGASVFSTIVGNLDRPRSACVGVPRRLDRAQRVTELPLPHILTLRFPAGAAVAVGAGTPAPPREPLPPPPPGRGGTGRTPNGNAAGERHGPAPPPRAGFGPGRIPRRWPHDRRATVHSGVRVRHAGAARGPVAGNQPGKGAGP